MGKLKITGTLHLEHAKSIALGVFDGFHVAHQAILSQEQTLVTFHPHPDIVTQKNPNLKYLSMPEELLRLYPKTAQIHFDKALMQLSAKDFLEALVAYCPHLEAIYVGEDFKFGHKQSGNALFLKDWALAKNISCHIIPLIQNTENKAIKSSLIRSLLKSNFDKAIEYLGHPYLISGIVQKGDQKGRLLGFPTANLLAPPEKCLPSFGVYKSQLQLNNTRYNSITYIGRKPTFSSKKTWVETHIFDFSADLYDQNVSIHLEKKIRDEIKFVSEEALKTQIQKDIKCCY